MPEKLKCPSCGGTQLGTVTHNGRSYRRCETPIKKNNGRHGRARREWEAPCGFWTTKESAWQSKSS